ncbi:hypothetical protein OROGR_026780 [Orobanche gracilis]
MDSILRMAQLNKNCASNVFNSTFLGGSSNPGSALGNGNMEAYISLPSNPMSFSGNNPMNVFQSDDAPSHLYQGCKKERKKQQSVNVKGSKDPCKSSPSFQASPPVKIKTEPQTLIPSPKKQRVDVINQQNIQKQKQEIIEKLLLKKSQDCNSQLVEMIEKYGLQNNQLQEPILHPAPQFRGFNSQPQKQVMRCAFQDQGNLQATFAPFLDGVICSRRLKQYLYHLRNNAHDNGIAYWKKFVYEYYAPGSKKRWCFCKYENIKLHTTGVFYPKSMETWSCDICGSRSGKGLEATFDILPRLFKTKFESGMLDEILFHDSPRACNISCGVVLEYRKAIQESVYDKFRVVHEGRLRIVFRYDLKILSWEFCTHNHEDFLLCSVFIPEINQLVQACKTYQNGIQNDASSRVSSENLQILHDTFVSTGDQLARNIETPLVNDLGYTKRFIRCLQIAEIVNSMKDVIARSLETKMGPIECLNSIYSSQSNKTHNQTGPQNLSSFPEQLGPEYLTNISGTFQNRIMSGSGSLGLGFVNLNHQLIAQNSSIAPMRQKGQDSGLTDHSNRVNGLPQPLDSRHYAAQKSRSSTHGKNPHQALIDKLLQEMVSAGRGKNQECGTRNKLCCGESSVPTFVQSDSGNASRNANFCKDASRGDSTAANQNKTIKTEPCSPEQVPEAFQSSALGSPKIEDMSW